MARPSTPHQGFLIPNASDVVDPILAEPDKIDFNTLANDRWGVLTGCLVSGDGGSSLSVGEGTAMVDGKFVTVEAVPNPTNPGLTVTVPPGSPRFTLIVVNDNGQVLVKPGKDSTDPVFPEPARNETVLAAVFCKTGVSVADSIIDKRKFLAPALLTKTDPTEDLIRNFQALGTLATDPPVNYYRVLGSGETIWSNDTRVYRATAGTLNVDDNLAVKLKITAGDDISGLTITASEDVTAQNLRRQGGPPSGPGLGDLWQSTSTGSIYVGNTKGDGATLEWDEIATVNGTLPPGTIISSLEEPTRMGSAGWLPLDGVTIANEQDYPNLFKVAALRPYHTAGTSAPNRTMKLPDLTGRVLISNHANAGFAGPTAPGGLRGNNNITLSRAQMPLHHHATDEAGQPRSAADVLPTWTTGDVGAIDLKVTVASGDASHTHPYTDPGHKHSVATAKVAAGLISGPAGTPDSTSVFTPNLGGRDRVDLDEADVGITIGSAQAPHTHLAEPTDIAKHNHGIAVHAIGGGGAFDITPNFFTVYMYVKT